MHFMLALAYSSFNIRITAEHMNKLGIRWIDLQQQNGTEAYDWRMALVAGTKALHHLLPSLIPPVDREYTIRFFHGNKGMHMGEERAFKEVFPAFAEIASRVTDDLAVNERSPMNTSPTKIVDNAIVGYVWSKLKVVSDAGAAASGH